MSAPNISAIFQAFLDQVSLRRWDEVKKFLRPTLAFNDRQGNRDEYVGHLAADTAKRNVTNVRADVMSVHCDGKSLGCRQVIKTENPDGTNKRETWAVILVFFDDEGKISRFYRVADQPGPDSPMAATVPPITPARPVNPIEADEIRETYHAYINSYNNGTMPDMVAQRWAPEVLLNGKPFKKDAVPVFLEKVLLPVIAGLKYAVDEMVIDSEKQQIAVRLSLEGVPENKSLQKEGLEGEKVRVYEHALYGFKDGKIAWAWATQEFDMTPTSG